MIHAWISPTLNSNSSSVLLWALRRWARCSAASLCRFVSECGPSSPVSTDLWSVVWKETHHHCSMHIVCVGIHCGRHRARFSHPSDWQVGIVPATPSLVMLAAFQGLARIRCRVIFNVHPHLPRRGVPGRVPRIHCLLVQLLHRLGAGCSLRGEHCVQ